jgi:hypothetical protein
MLVQPVGKPPPEGAVSKSSVKSVVSVVLGEKSGSVNSGTSDDATGTARMGCDKFIEGEGFEVAKLVCTLGFWPVTLAIANVSMKIVINFFIFHEFNGLYIILIWLQRYKIFLMLPANNLFFCSVFMQENYLISGTKYCIELQTISKY